MDISIIQRGESRQCTTFNDDTKNKTIRIAPGKTEVLMDISGPGIIGRIWFTFNGWFFEHWNKEEQNIDPIILKTLILRIYWDGNQKPAVEVPIGDFFGIGNCEYRHFLSKYIGMSSGGFYCYFPMPFKSVRMTIENLHESINPHFFMNANYNLVEELPKDSGRFHCQFHTGRNTGGEPTVVLKSKGAGQFVGCNLSMQGQSPNYLSFLEAPEYFFIDNQEQAAIIGTGLEDYFNGGWYFRDGEFSGRLHGVPLKDPLRSMVSMYRFHETDTVLFKESLIMQFMSPWGAEHLLPFWYSSAAFYYLFDQEGEATSFPNREQLLSFYRHRDMDHQSIP